MSVKVKPSTTGVGAGSSMVIQIDGIWVLDDFVKLFSGLMFAHRLLELCEEIREGNEIQHSLIDLKETEDRKRVIRTLLEAHSVSGAAGTIKLPLEASHEGYVLSVTSPRILEIFFASPGRITLIGASGIFKEIRKLYEFQVMKETIRSRKEAEAAKALEDVKAQKLKNFEASLKLLRALGFTDTEIKELIGGASDWISVFEAFHREGKIKKIEVKNEDQKDRDDDGLLVD